MILSAPDHQSWQERQVRLLSVRCFPTSDGCRMLQAYAVNRRVGVPMHLPPLGSFTAKDQGHAQRPVLVRQLYLFRFLVSGAVTW
jgi:hypothetical protein